MAEVQSLEGVGSGKASEHSGGDGEGEIGIARKQHLKEERGIGTGCIRTCIPIRQTGGCS